MFYEVLNKKINLKSNIPEENNASKKQSFFTLLIKNFMDDRSRTTDTVCFLIILEILYGISYFIIMGEN